jgi:hypothetical protein
MVAVLFLDDRCRPELAEEDLHRRFVTIAGIRDVLRVIERDRPIDVLIGAAVDVDGGVVGRDDLDAMGGRVEIRRCGGIDSGDRRSGAGGTSCGPGSTAACWGMMAICGASAAGRVAWAEAPRRSTAAPSAAARAGPPVSRKRKISVTLGSFIVSLRPSNGSAPVRPPCFHPQIRL